MKRLGLVLMAFLLVSVVALADEFTDNFDDGNYYGWLEPLIVQDHFDWDVESGELHATYESEDFGVGVLYSPVGAVTDFTCEFILTRKVTGGAFTDGVIRVSDDGRCVVWQVDHDSLIMLAYNDGGEQQTLHLENISMGEFWHTMKLQVSGSTPTLTITAWWDGVQKWTGDIIVSDALFQGHVGLFASGDTASIWFDDFSMTYESYTGVKESEPIVPSVSLLSQSIPNPAIDQARIEYTIPTASRVQLKIYNVLGAVVRTLVDDTKSAGRYGIVWDGRDYNGKKLPSGSYFYQLKTEEFTGMKKLILLK